MKLSKFAHKMNHGTEEIVLFNSLIKEPVLVSEELYNQLLKSIRSGAALDDEAMNIAKVFKAKKIFVPATLDENKLLNELRESENAPRDIDIAYFILTDTCNLGCPHCFMLNNEKFIPKGGMTSEDALNFLDYYCEIANNKSSQGKQIILFGGEPTLNQNVLHDISDRVAEYRALGKIHKDTELVLNTNGTLFNDSLVESLLKSNAIVVISLDGPKQINDLVRKYKKSGAGSFEDVNYNIKRYIDKGLRVSLAVTVTDELIPKIEELVALIGTYKGLSGVSLNYLRNAGSTFSDHYSRAVSFGISFAEKLQKIGIVEGKYALMLQAFLSKGLASPECGAAGAGQIVFTPDTKVGICQGSMQISPNEYTAVDYSCRPDVYIDEINMWKKRLPVNIEECVSCSAFGICGGGCSLDAKMKGSMMTPDGEYCTVAREYIKHFVTKLVDLERGCDERNS